MSGRNLLFAVTISAVAVFFASCREDVPQTGAVDLTLGQKTYRMTSAEFSISGDSVRIFGSNEAQSVEINFRNKGVNQYVIGYGKDSAAMWNRISNLDNFSPETRVRFLSALDEQEEYVVVRGLMRVEEFGSDSITGWFSAKGLTPAQDSLLILGELSKDSLEKSLKTFSAKFVAVP